MAPPDKDGRRAILAVHTRSLPLAGDVDLDALAATTPGMTRADLANLANEAALTAARRRHDQVHMRDFTDALERIVLGAERKILMTSEDRRRTRLPRGGPRDRRHGHPPRRSCPQGVDDPPRTVPRRDVLGA